MTTACKTVAERSWKIIEELERYFIGHSPDYVHNEWRRIIEKHLDEHAAEALQKNPRLEDRGAVVKSEKDKEYEFLESLPRCPELDGSTLKIVPSYTEGGYFCEANCVTITDGVRTAIYVPLRKDKS